MFPDKRFQENFDELCALGKVTVNGATYNDILTSPESVLVSVFRCQEELIRATSRLNSAANAASNRWKNKETKHAHAMLSINNHQSTTIKKETRARSYDARFVFWFEGYPEKVGKGAAEKAFLKALKGGTSEEALSEGLRRYIAFKPADRPWCNPATWLNQERWNDEYATNGSGAVSEPRGPRTPAPTLRELGLET